MPTSTKPLPLHYSVPQKAVAEARTPEQPSATEAGALPLVRIPAERKNWRQELLALLALACIVSAFAFVVVRFHSNANEGVDQNGYMTEGRWMLHGKLWTHLQSPWQYLGRMMVVTPNGRALAKYPLGLPAMAAVARLVGGPDGIYWVDPVAVMLACTLAFFLFRKFVGDFLALLGVCVLAFNPITLSFTNDTNSHGLALLCTVSGFLFLVDFWQKGTWWRALLAGFCLSYSGTVRYTDFLWFIPLVYVLFVPLRDQRVTWPQRIAGLAGFAIPAGLLSLANWYCFGAPWRTGYALCDEQTGFAWKYFYGTAWQHGNWQTVLEQFDGYGLMIIFPLALGGLVRLFWDNWKAATLLALWVVPGATLYMWYYWAPAGLHDVGYLRFFLNFCPALILAAMWFVARTAGNKQTALVVTAALLVALSAGYSAHAMGPHMLQQYRQRRQYSQAEHEVHRVVPLHSLIFTVAPMGNQLGSQGGYDLYDAQLFSPNGFRYLHMQVKRKGPDPFQRSRALIYLGLVGRKDQTGHWRPKPFWMLRDSEVSIIRQALAKGQQVYFLLHRHDMGPLMPHHHKLAFKEVAAWHVAPWWSMRRMMHRPWMRFNPKARAQLQQRMEKQQHMMEWVLTRMTPYHPPVQKPRNRAYDPAARAFWRHFFGLQEQSPKTPKNKSAKARAAQRH